MVEALKVLEWAGVLSWQNRITRAIVRQRDLWGRWSNRWTIIRTSNAYVFRDPQVQLTVVPEAQSENRIGTQYQEDLNLRRKPATDTLSAPLERALARLGGAVAVKNGIEEAAPIG